MKLYQNPTAIIPERIRFFFCFSVMAWVSLFKPQHGRDFIDDAVEGSYSKARKEIFESWRGNRHD